jgi:hypothetical protein
VTTFPTPAAQADVLDKAADHLTAHGWIQGSMYDTQQVAGDTPLGECRTDVLGALKAVVLGEPRWGGSIDDLAVVDLALTALHQHVGAEPIGWNDVDGRTVDEVIAAMRETAASLRAAAVDAPEVAA